MLTTSPPAKDDRLTLISISALACILQDILHEGLGHGVTAWLSGAHKMTISTVALESDISTRWISANGTLVNLFFAVVFWLLLRKPNRYSPALRYFFALALAANLFTGTGYFFVSGVTNFGDWGAVIAGFQPHWLWQLGMIVIGTASYYASVLLVRAKLLPFREFNPVSRRIRGLCWIPYVADGVLAGLSGLLNPFGLFYVFVSALPSTLGANAGFLVLPSMLRNRRTTQMDQSEVSQAALVSGASRGKEATDESVARVEPFAEFAPVAPIRCSNAWIAVGAIASLLYIFVLGRGLTWSR